MVFSSILFIVYFLPVFLAAYWLSGWRTAVLLTGSVLFYVWGEGAYIALLGALIILNHQGARMLAGRSDDRMRGGLFAGLVVVDLAVLAFFKYGAFLAINLNDLFPGLGLPERGPHLPLGISFFTFQLISYLADVHARRVEAEARLSRFAVYILMFPHLIAGPIVRYADIRAQLQGDRRTSARVGLGLQYFIVGLSMKVLVANTVAPVADYAFGLPSGELSTATAWTGAFAYALQIYFDFGGYSNMAIGLAFLLGFHFPKNFDHPYAARSITDFWRRWHISLSSWFRDYVYIPLGGNRRGLGVTARNLIIVFLLTGFWHGAAWTFLAWGVFHGAFLLIERVGLKRLLDAAPAPLAHAYALLVVLVGWVIFRAEDLTQAAHYIARMADFGALAAFDFGLIGLLTPERLAAMMAGVLFAAPTLNWTLTRLKAPLAEPAPLHADRRLDTGQVHVLPTPILLAGLILSIALLAASTVNPFLYFRF